MPCHGGRAPSKKWGLACTWLRAFKNTGAFVTRVLATTTLASSLFSGLLLRLGLANSGATAKCGAVIAPCPNRATSKKGSTAALAIKKASSRNSLAFRISNVHHRCSFLCGAVCLASHADQTTQSELSTVTRLGETKVVLGLAATSTSGHVQAAPSHWPPSVI